MLSSAKFPQSASIWRISEQSHFRVSTSVFACSRLISLDASSNRPCVRETSMTFDASASAKASAMPKPMPSDAPATSTVRPDWLLPGDDGEMVGYVVRRNVFVNSVILDVSRRAWKELGG